MTRSIHAHPTLPRTSMRITRTARRTGLSLAGLSLAGLLPAATAAQGIRARGRARRRPSSSRLERTSRCRTGSG